MLCIGLSSMPSVECPHADRCGGCALIDLPYPVQLERKRGAIASALAGYAELRGVEAAPTVAATIIENYRTRAKLVVSEGHVGLYEKGNHRVVDVPGCRVLRPVVARVVDAVRSGLPFRCTLLALDVREVDSGTLVTLIVPPETDASEVRSVAEELMQRCSDILGVSWAVRERMAPTLLGSSPIPLVGCASAPHRLDPAGPFHEAVPGSFVQAHAGQASRLHAAIESAMETVLGGVRGKRVVDLYAGGGALALRLAARGARVTAVDSFAPGLRELNRAAQRQDLQLTVKALAAEQALENLDRPDAVVVNPPRRGLSTRARTRLCALRPPLILYVSCEPNRLARDLAHLARLGLGTQSLTPLDMIPLTDAVETLAVLVPCPAPAAELLYRDERWIVVAKPPHVSTSSAGSGEFAAKGSLTASVRALTGLGTATSLLTLSTESSGVCVFAAHAENAETLSTSLLDSHLEFTALVTGITHKKGHLRRLPTSAKAKYAEARYVRERVVGTHSLVRVFGEFASANAILQRFADLGHPVLGDNRFGSSTGNRYFEARYGLDRPFFHLAAIELRLGTGASTIMCELAPDLRAVLDELECARTE